MACIGLYFLAWPITEEDEQKLSFLKSAKNVFFLYITVKLGDKEHFDKEQIVVMELFTDYQPYYTINLLLDKELLPI